MSERKYVWKAGAGKAAIILLVFAILFNCLAIRSAYRYYPYTDLKNQRLNGWINATGTTSTCGFS